MFKEPRPPLTRKYPTFDCCWGQGSVGISPEPADSELEVMMIGTRGEVDPAAKLPLMAKSVGLSILYLKDHGT